MIPETLMFPKPTEFGTECAIDPRISDDRAVQIVNRTHKQPSERDERSLRYVQAQYTNPNFNLTVSRYLNTEKCREDYTIGKSSYEKSSATTKLDGYSVEGYRYKIGTVEGCCFIYENVVVLVAMYDHSDEEKIIRPLIDHFDAVAE